jgi:multidrug efflux pump subunit AcrA (membrane-fusion protein)
MGAWNAAVVIAGDDVWTQVKVGQPVRVMVDVIPGLDLAARVQVVSPYQTVINQQRGYHYVNIEITDPSDPRVAPSQTVRATITTLDVPNVLVVPNTAVSTEGARSFVTGMDGQRLPFTPGAVGDDLTEVREGLSDGQPIRMR